MNLLRVSTLEITAFVFLSFRDVQCMPDLQVGVGGIGDGGGGGDSLGRGGRGDGGGAGAGRRCGVLGALGCGRSVGGRAPFSDCLARWEGAMLPVIHRGRSNGSLLTVVKRRWSNGRHASPERGVCFRLPAVPSRLLGLPGVTFGVIAQASSRSCAKVWAAVG